MDIESKILQRKPLNEVTGLVIKNCFLQTKAGFDPVLSNVERRKSYLKGGTGSRKKWLDYLKTNNGRRN